MKPTTDTTAFDWDLFCRVVDNFGDIGVCWRLARDLAVRHGQAVRLWVDDWAAFRRLCPMAASDAEAHQQDGIAVRHWAEPFPDVLPARNVIEAFACELPSGFLARMAALRPAPVWLNLEYLSAEDWVEGCHGLGSPHPRWPLTKHFFFPGFTSRTGGLLREAGLLDARDRLQGDAEGRRIVLEGFAGVAVASEAVAISLFAYEQPAIGALIDAWSRSARPYLLLVPEGRVVTDVARALGGGLAPGAPQVRGALTVAHLPFLSQDDYDRLLWACDLNFVRGEDSFVRAQWAARPFVWHIYRQADDVHIDKLEAFAARFVAGLGAPAAAALRAFWHAWNGRGEVAEAWPAFEAALPELGAHGRTWAAQLASADDLSTALVKFSKSTLK